jgi:uncharacterized protein (TIGR03067 family)
MKWVWRVLIVLVAVLVLGVGTLFGLGLRTDAGVMRSSIEISAPPATVWPWLTQGDKLKAWVGWLVEVRPTGPHREVWVMEDRNNGNARVEIEGTSTLEDPPRRLEAHTITTGAFEGDQAFKLTDLGGRTRLDMESRFHFSQWFARLMEPVIAHEAHVKMIDDLARLKTKVEAEMKELDALQGSWKVVALEMNGGSAPAAAIQGAKIIIKGDQFESIAMGATLTGTIEINPSATPKTFDLVYSSGSGLGHRSLGIYELDGNKWKACFTAREAARPTEFAAPKGSAVVLDHLEREP